LGLGAVFKIILGATEEEDIDEHRFNELYSGATEWDHIEWPTGGNTLTRYHNCHAPGTNVMKNYAEKNNLTPVYPKDSSELLQDRDNSEWDTAIQAGHIIAVNPDEDGYVYYGEYFKLRCVHWAPNNPYGKPDNSVEWYVTQSNSGLPFRRVAGVLAPPWWGEEHPSLPKQLFLNNAVGGNFVNANEFIYAKGLGSTDRLPKIRNIIAKINVYQFTDLIAGGSGYPDADGLWGRGMLPTADDTTGNSGTGTVTTPDTTLTSGREITLILNKELSLKPNEGNDDDNDVITPRNPIIDITSDTVYQAVLNRPRGGKLYIKRVKSIK